MGETNPPPNISCRYFTYSAEYIIWARKIIMFLIIIIMIYEMSNANHQMTDVWNLSAIEDGKDTR